MMRTVAALVLAIAAGATGYAANGGQAGAEAQTIAAPAPGSVRILYSLDRKQNDQEIIALIDAAKSRILFAMYVFTLHDIADALIAAKQRGVEVRGLVDAGESANSYNKPIVEKLLAAGIPVVTEKHASGTGIMHIKAIVTDSAYALGSYNWTNSATNINDELLEIGTDETLRQAYENILQKLLVAYAGNSVKADTTAPASAGTIDYTDAPAHIGEYTSVRGTLVKAYTSKSGTVFLDFCANYKNCAFSGVIFADDVKKFGLPAQAGDLSYLVGKTIILTGKIASYQGKAEIVLTSPAQITR